MTSPALSIGDFARATHVSIKMLRHYHRIGLLEPAAVDPDTGYRRYRADQIPTAQVIRRFRDLDMPLDRIRIVLDTPDLDTRNRLITEHLDALQDTLEQTQSAIASLRDLLERPAPERESGIVVRQVEATPVAAISETIDIDDASPWYQGAIGELYATLAAQDVADVGHPGGVYDNDLFVHERGQATVFVPSITEVRPTGRVVATVIPAVELAVVEHVGPHRDIDRAYGALAAYVARHALGVDGPIREYYLVGGHDTRDSHLWRTEIGWPVFSTRGSG
jgi:DNA-binding transcriptional MerR regulator